jgi:hypothetical protein
VLASVKTEPLRGAFGGLDGGCARRGVSFAGDGDGVLRRGLRLQSGAKNIGAEQQS